MGRLAGFKYREIVKRLKYFGFGGMRSNLLLTNFCLLLFHLPLEVFACGLLPHTCTRNSQQQT